MRLLTLKGTPREVGRQYGEACRDGFHELSVRAEEAAARSPRWHQDIGFMRKSIRRYFPLFLDELTGMAEGSALTLDQVLLNHRLFLSAAYLDPIDLPTDACCTNMAFLKTPNGPIFGKNLDLSPNPANEYAIRDVTYDNGARVVHSVVVGELTSRDTCINGHGLTLGGSSVGSVFQQSIHNVPIEVALYEMLRTCSTTDQAVRFLQRFAYVGKGYNFVLVDEGGVGVVLECACPMVQVRLPEPGRDVIFCTNSYKLTPLLKADLRPPKGMEYSEKRFHYLERKLYKENAPHTVEQMKALLSSHDDGEYSGLCRPIDPGDDDAKTRMSVITLPAERQYWVTDGQPSVTPFERVA